MNEGDQLRLTVTHSTVDGHIRLSMAGVLDLLSVNALESTLASLRPLTGRLEIDLGAVTFMDSSGIRVLLAFRLASEEDTGDPARLVTASPEVQKVLELTGLGSAFDGPASD